MMRLSDRTRLIGLVTANAVLVVTLALGGVVDRRDATSEPLLTAGPDEISRVVFAGDRPLELERTVGGWDLIVEGGRYPAREDRIEPFLEALADSRIVRTVSANPAIADELGLGDDAREITLTAAGANVSFSVGASAGSRGLYVRRGQDQPVEVAEGDTGFYLEQQLSFWAYLRVLPESARPGELVRARVVREADPLTSAEQAWTGAYELTRGADGERDWVVEIAGSRADVDPDRALAVARDIVDLVGTGFYAGPVADAEPLGRVELVLADGREFTVRVERAGGETVVTAGGPGLPGEAYGGLRYTISESRLERLFPAPARLLAG